MKNPSLASCGEYYYFIHLNIENFIPCLEFEFVGTKLNVTLDLYKYNDGLSFLTDDMTLVIRAIIAQISLRSYATYVVFGKLPLTTPEVMLLSFLVAPLKLL